MKKIKKSTPRWLKEKTWNLKIEQEIDLKTVLSKGIDEYGPKEILEYMFFLTSFEGLPYITSMIRILATKKNVQSVETMIILKYILDKWNELLKGPATKHWKTILEKAEERQKNERKTKTRHT